ncbi:MAG: hypothetical protein K9M51_01935 [Candidatus Gracilibacteria bacterium]|nr:hypothetical protein [Candidatus Gracilibacteria bacterium]
MKKFLLISALIAMPILGVSATLDSLQEARILRNEGAFQNFYKGRSGDSGIRARDLEPYYYRNTNLTNKLYKRNVGHRVDYEEVEVGDFLHWKQARRAAYWDSQGDNKIYKEAFGYILRRPEQFQPPHQLIIEQEKSDLDGQLSGRQKLMRLQSLR